MEPVKWSINLTADGLAANTVQVQFWKVEILSVRTTVEAQLGDPSRACARLRCGAIDR